MILNIVTPIIVATCIYNLVSTIDMYIFYFAMDLQNMKSVTATIQFGVYAGEYIVLQNVPVALASAMSTASIPAISSSWVKRDVKQTREHIRSGIRITMLVLIPACVGMAVLAYPIMGVLFPQKSTIMTATLLLTLGSPAIAFYGLSTLSNGILQALGEVNVPLKNATIALIFHVLLVALLLFFTPLRLYALIIGNCTYALHVCYLNQKALKKKIGYRQEIRKTYLLPIVASIIMGIVVAGVYFGLFKLTRMVFIPLVLSVIVGIIIYFTVIIFLYSSHLEELDAIPYMSKITRRFQK